MLKGKEYRFLAIFILLFLISTFFIVYSDYYEMGTYKQSVESEIEVLKHRELSIVKIVTGPNCEIGSEEYEQVVYDITRGKYNNLLLSTNTSFSIRDLRERRFKLEDKLKQYINTKIYIVVAQTIVLMLMFIGLALLQKDLS